MRELKPSNYWNIGKIESWLSDMALKGYFLETMDSIFCDFKEDEPKSIYYRIEIAERGNNLSQEQNLKYNKDIWTNVTNYNKFYVFSCPSEDFHSEPNLSPEPLMKILKPIFLTTLLKLMIALVAPVLILRFLPYITNSSTFISLLRSTNINLTPYALVLWCILSLGVNAYYQWKLIRTISKGTSIDHHTPWKKTYWISSAVWSFKIMFITFVLLSPIILSQILLPNLEVKHLTVAAVPEPIVRLEDIETIDGSTFDEERFKDGFCYKGAGILTPQQIYSREYGNSNTDYYNAIYTEYYKLTFPKTQTLVVNDLIDESYKFYNTKDSSGEDTFKTEIINNENLDYLVYGCDSYTPYILSKHIFAAKDGIVLHIQYSGEKGKEDLIKVVSDLFATKIKKN